MVRRHGCVNIPKEGRCAHQQFEPLDARCAGCRHSEFWTGIDAAIELCRRRWRERWAREESQAS